MLDFQNGTIFVDDKPLRYSFRITPKRSLIQKLKDKINWWKRKRKLRGKIKIVYKDKHYIRYSDGTQMWFNEL